jgi:hypothetical protein
MSRVSFVRISTPEGMISEWPGRRSTSSKVKASTKREDGETAGMANSGQGGRISLPADFRELAGAHSTNRGQRKLVSSARLKAFVKGD